MLKLTYSILPISDVYVLAKTRDVTPLIFRVHIYFISAGSPELILWESLSKKWLLLATGDFVLSTKNIQKSRQDPSGKILMYAIFSSKI